jgi:hypothetical protein
MVVVVAVAVVMMTKIQFFIYLYMLNSIARGKDSFSHVSVK